MVDRLGVAGLPRSIKSLELPLLVLDLLPDHLTGKFVFDNGPLIRGKDGGIKGSSGFLGLAFQIILGFGDLVDLVIGWSGLGAKHRLVAAVLPGPFAQLLDLCWSSLLRLGGVDLWFRINVGGHLLGLAVRLHLGEERCSIISHLVFEGVAQMEDGDFIPDDVDGVEAAPDRGSIL